MIRKEDVKKMLVSDDGENWNERYVLLILENERALSVHADDEHSFDSGFAFDTEWWKFCKPIPEKKKRPMTRNEAMKFVIKNDVFVRVGGKAWFFSSNFEYKSLDGLEYIFADELGTDHETPKKFEIEED